MGIRFAAPGKVTVDAPLVGRGRHAARQLQRVRGWLILTVCCVAAIAGIALWIGPAPVMAPWDVFTLLEGGYRIYEGQAPSAGFSNPIGPLVYGLVAIGMHMQHAPSLRAVTYGQVMFLVIASSLAWAAAWRRLPTPYAAGFTIFVALLSVADRPLGYAPSITSYAMLYNRDGWLLYASLLLLVLVPRRADYSGTADYGGTAEATGRGGKGGKGTAIIDGLLLGLLLGLVFFDKITFFLAAMVAVGLGLLLGTLRRDSRLGAAAVAGLAIVTVLVLLVFRLDIAGYIGQLAQAAIVQLASRRVHLLVHAAAWATPSLLVAAVMAWLLYRKARRDGQSAAPLARLAVAAAYVLGSGVLISAGDANERSDLPALVVVPLLFVSFLDARPAAWAGGSLAEGKAVARSAGRRLVLLGLALLLAGTTIPIAAQDVLGMAKAVSYRGYVASPPASQAIEAAPYRDFVIPASSQWQTAYRTAYTLPAMINDGLSLLRSHLRPGQTVVALAYSNPFDMALGLSLQQCGPLWWDLNYDFDQSHYPSAQCAIGDATWVIIPRLLPGASPDQTLSAMLSLYTPYLDQHYRQVQETSNWILLRRTS